MPLLPAPPPGLVAAIAAVALAAPAQTPRTVPAAPPASDVLLAVRAGPACARARGTDRARRLPGAPWPYRCPVPGPLLRTFDGPVGRYAPGHRGIDLLATPGDVVRSPGAGRVTFAGPVAGRPVVVVDHGGGWRTTLEPVHPATGPGTVVAPGAAVGWVAVPRAGAGRTPVTGDATGPSHCAPATCVHLGVRRGDVYVDPLTLLGRSPVVLLPVRRALGGG